MPRISFTSLCLMTLGCLAVTSACSEGSSDDTTTTGGTAPAAGGAGNPNPGGGGTTTGTGGTGVTPVSPTANPAFPLFTFALGKNGVGPGAGDPPPADDITTASTITQDPDVSSPCKADTDKGSLKIVAPFTAYPQRVDLQFMLNGPVDYTGRTLYMWLRYESGFNPDPSSPGGLMFYAKSGDTWTWGQAAWKNIEKTSMGEWQLISFDLANPELANSAGFDPAALMSIGFVIHTGDNANGTTEMPTEATFHIDCIGYSPA